MCMGCAARASPPEVFVGCRVSGEDLPGHNAGARAGSALGVLRDVLLRARPVPAGQPLGHRPCRGQ